MKANDIAEKLQEWADNNPHADDKYIIYEAVYIRDGDSAELSGNTDDVEVRNGDWLCYLIQDGETVAVLDREIYTGELEDIVASINAKYCEDKGLIQCIHCQSFEEKLDGVQECESCGKHVSDSNWQEVIPDNCTEVEDGDYQKLWLCNERLPTDDDPSKHTFVFVRLQYMKKYESDFPQKYCVAIVASNPSMSPDLLAKTCKEYEMEVPDDDAVSAQILVDGIAYATLWEVCGNSQCELLKAANEQLKVISVIGGFYLDKAQNAIGSSGWDFMRGDVLGGLNRK